MNLNNIITERLLLIPFTTKMVLSLISGEMHVFTKMNLGFGNGWPDQDALETMPKILKNLTLVEAPTGFESWLVVKKDQMLIIGDVGFKGQPDVNRQVDVGYGIVALERKKGYAFEATKGLIEWAFLSGKVDAITARSLILNVDSIQVLRKLSFYEVSRDMEMINWSLAKPDLF